MSVTPAYTAGRGQVAPFAATAVYMNPAAWRLRALRNLQSGQFASGLRVLDEWISQRPDEFEPQFLRIQMLLQCGQVRDAAEQTRRWEALKQAERRSAAPGAGMLDSVPVALPALTRARKLGRRAAEAGFDWPDSAGPRAKIDEASGLGLGLFIAKTLLERSGAAVRIGNRAGPQAGAMIDVRWPRGAFERGRDDEA